MSVFHPQFVSLTLLSTLLDNFSSLTLCPHTLTPMNICAGAALPRAFGITLLYVLALCSTNGTVSLGSPHEPEPVIMALVARQCRGNGGGCWERALRDWIYFCSSLIDSRGLRELGHSCLRPICAFRQRVAARQIEPELPLKHHWERTWV